MRCGPAQRKDYMNKQEEDSYLQAKERDCHYDYHHQNYQIGRFPFPFCKGKYSLNVENNSTFIETIFYPSRLYTYSLCYFLVLFCKEQKNMAKDIGSNVAGSLSQEWAYRSEWPGLCSNQCRGNTFSPTLF